MDKILDIMRILVIISIVMFVATSVIRFKFDKVNDPNRDYYITLTDSNLTFGEIYEMEFIPAHIDTNEIIISECVYGKYNVGDIFNEFYESEGETENAN
jgi:hypothetical protein